jgi:hypothetical protein
MRAESLLSRWVALLLTVALLSTSCTTRHGARLRRDDTPVGASPLPALSFPPLAEPSEPERLHRRWGARGLGAEIATVRLQEVLPPAPPTCGGLPVPPSWPDFSSGDQQQLLAPFFSCASPAEFIALQQRVDMPRLLESLDDWSAVRLGALGPVREDAAPLLQRKRAAFLVSTAERYGLYHAEVFTLFVLHSAHDDEVEEVLRLLAADRLLGQTLALMPSVCADLEARGLPLSRYPERDTEAGDVLRGMGRALRDALATSPVADGGRYSEMAGRWKHLPPPYQQAADQVERALIARHFSLGSVALGTFDHVTFGVPLGFYYLVAGTGQGLASLTQGEFEQASRELAPALLLGTLFAGGKGLRALSARGATGLSTPALHGLQAVEPRLRGLQEVARQLETTLGADGLRELAREIRARREAGRFVAVGGVDAFLALREARGEVARAQALLSKARPGATGAGQVATLADDAARSTPKPASAGGALASLVDEGVGLTREVLQTRLALVELEAQGPRLPRDVAVLKQHRPSPNAPPPGAAGNPRWAEYVAYYARRLKEIEAGRPAEGPLHWRPYERMWGWFTRGLAFERQMLALLEADARLPPAQRRFLGAFLQPRIERYVGVWKPGSALRFVDVLVIEEGGLSAGPPRVETFSFKSRDLSRLDENSLKAQMIEDAREALWKYGETLDIRRDSLQPLLHEGSVVPVQRVRLVYEGGQFKPTKGDVLKAAVDRAQEKVPGVEISFQ